MSKKQFRVAIIISKFNEFITQRLLDGCLDQLNKHGLLKKNIQIVWVPGAFEIPVMALKLAKKKTIDSVICLGAIIEGETDHYRLVADSTANGIMEVSLRTGKPIVYEVLATKTVELANKRSKVKGANKGRDAADVAVEMIQLMSKV